nr:uncharacterized protein LOC122269140 [Parasteatoda tepidariorum]
MAENEVVVSSTHQYKNSGTPLVPFDHAQYFLIALTNPTVPNTSFSRVSPFLIHKALLSLLGEVASVKKLRSGVISQSEFINDTEENIVEELRDQHVIAVRRIKIRRDGQLIPTKHLILTFATPNLPSAIKLAWYNCPVRPYVPNPLRCFQCQRFGHSKASCRSKPICARCSSSDHADTTCELQPHCVNCNGDHAAYSRNCTKCSQEKEIQSVKVLQNLTFNEARRIVTARTPHPGVSYSAAIKVTRCSVSTQTDLPPLPSTSHQVENAAQKSKFNFNAPSNRTTSPPPKNTQKKPHLSPSSSYQQKYP